MRTLTRLLMVAVVALTIFASVPAAMAITPGGTFTDDDGNPHEGYIEAIAASGITAGCNAPINDKYCPDQSVTRGQMAAFLVRSLGLTSDGGKDWFDDDDDTVFEADINRLAAANITSGCGGGDYCPDRTLTRAEMAAFLVRAFNLTDSGTDAFNDDDSSIHEAEINKLRAAGITFGCNPPVNDRFCPTAPVRRDEMASFIGRAKGLTPMTPPPRLDDVDIDIHVYPGDDIGSIAKNSPEGTVFMIHGTHHRQTIKPRDGQWFLGADDAVLDGDDTTDYAFDGSADDVLIRGLEIRDYDSNKQRGAIDADGGDWTVEACDIHHNAALGVRLASGTPTIRFNKIHHNYQLGINVPHSVNGLIEGNEIAYNNFEQDYGWGWEAGATKFWSTTNLTVRGNWSHHNHGPGFWADHDNRGILYEDNLIEDNYANGIYHEISYDGVMRNNTIRRNGFGHDSWLWGGGIVIASSQGVEIYGNVIEDNFNGITITQQDRGTGDYGPYVARNNYVHDNVVIDSGLTGAGQDIGDNSIYESSGNNRFENNDYVGDVRWQWRAHSHSWSEWQDFGHDETGSYTP